MTWNPKAVEMIDAWIAKGWHQFVLTCEEVVRYQLWLYGVGTLVWLAASILCYRLAKTAFAKFQAADNPIDRMDWSFLTALACLPLAFCVVVAGYDFAFWLEAWIAPRQVILNKLL